MSDGSKRGVGVEQGHLQLSVPGVPSSDGAPSQSITFAAGYRSSALPSPEELSAYERILPGAADRILRMAEKQLDHEHHYSKLSLWVTKISEVTGIVVGAAVTLVTTVGAFALLWRGDSASAVKVFFAGVVTLAAAVGLNRLIEGKGDSQKQSTAG